ncbi:hypothetical protein GCM10025859_34180 [Alicyclobacillus fastidiosus]|nr:hypothetical protein GCM10025859_34180 [Alicyclobacillus fastidiosus]
MTERAFEWRDLKVPLVIFLEEDTIVLRGLHKVVDTIGSKNVYSGSRKAAFGFGGKNGV